MGDNDSSPSIAVLSRFDDPMNFLLLTLFYFLNDLMV